MNILEAVIRCTKPSGDEEETYSYEVTNKHTGLVIAESGFGSENEARLACGSVISEDPAGLVAADVPADPETEENTSDSETESTESNDEATDPA